MPAGSAFAVGPRRAFRSTRCWAVRPRRRRAQRHRDGTGSAAERTALRLEPTPRRSRGHRRPAGPGARLRLVPCARDGARARSRRRRGHGGVRVSALRSGGCARASPPSPGHRGEGVTSRRHAPGGHPRSRSGSGPGRVRARSGAAAGLRAPRTGPGRAGPQGPHGDALRVAGFRERFPHGDRGGRSCSGRRTSPRSTPRCGLSSSARPEAPPAAVRLTPRQPTTAVVVKRSPQTCRREVRSVMASLEPGG